MDPLPEAPRLLREAPPEVEGSEVLGIEAYILAQRFHHLPEPERSALALFYLDLFDTTEIAQIVNLSLEQLADTLSRARLLLKDEPERRLRKPCPAVNIKTAEQLLPCFRTRTSYGFPRGEGGTSGGSGSGVA